MERQRPMQGIFSLEIRWERNLDRCLSAACRRFIQRNEGFAVRSCAKGERLGGRLADG